MLLFWSWRRVPLRVVWIVGGGTETLGGLLELVAHVGGDVLAP